MLALGSLHLMSKGQGSGPAGLCSALYKGQDWAARTKGLPSALVRGLWGLRSVLGWIPLCLRTPLTPGLCRRSLPTLLVREDNTCAELSGAVVPKGPGFKSSSHHSHTFSVFHSLTKHPLILSPD